MTLDEPAAVPAPASDAASDRSAPSLFPGAALAAILMGLIAGAIYRRGAFYPADAFGIAVVSVALIVAALSKPRDRYGVTVVVTAGGLALWWFVRARLAGSPATFLPLGASLLGFVAAFSVVRTLGRRDRTRVAVAVVALGAVTAAVGLAGLMGRWGSVTEEVDGVWRVSSTLTYSAAAAVLFIVSLLLVMAMDLRLPVARAAVCLCLAGLIATQSHWDLLALAAGALFVPWRRWLMAVWPLAMGVLAGTITLASAAGSRPTWPSIAGLIAAVAVSMVGRHGSTSRTWRPVAVAALVVVAGGTWLLVVSPPVGRVASEPASQSQTLAWSASSQAWRSSIVTGTGPARIGATRGSVDGTPGFAPDGYLTVIADGGLVGGLLLVVGGASVAATIRRRGALSSCAVGATMAFAVAGSIDFDWQLPALALVGGCAAGLAARPIGPAHRPEAGSPAGRWARLPGGPAAAWTLVVVLVVAVELIVGATQDASALPRIESVQPAPIANPQEPARSILTGPDPTDPFMLRVGDRYYLYTSEGTSFLNVPLRTGDRPGHWSKPVDVLPRLPLWAEGGLTWAPDVQKVKGGWALYFTALLSGVDPLTHCIGSAFATSPAGPFLPTARPFICQLDHRGSIDARVYVDTGNRLDMLWKSEDNANPNVPGPDQNGVTGIYAQQLSADGRVLLGPAVKIFAPTEPWEGTIVEAPDLVEAWGTYWMFFSGNWYYSTSYGIGVAECQTPFGPCSDPRSGPFLGSNRQGTGPGESSLFRDGSDVYLLYNPFRANDPGPVIPRPVVMARLGFSPAGPYLAAPGAASSH